MSEFAGVASEIPSQVNLNGVYSGVWLIHQLQWQRFEEFA
jgi:hypothetical protein